MKDLGDAVRSGDIETLKSELANFTGNVDELKSGNWRLVEWAAIEGQVESLAALVDAGSQPQGIPNLLHTCIFSGWGQGEDVAFVEALLSAGCDANQRDNGETGITPLFRAAMTAPFPRRSAAATKLLLEHGADPNLRSTADMTPLHFAASGIATETVRMLLEAGSDANAIDRDGKTPAHRCVEALWEAQTDEDVEDALYIIHSNMTLLIKHGADLTIRDSNGETVLQTVITNRHITEEFVTLMLDGGSPADDVVVINDESLDLLAVSELFRFSPQMYIRLFDAGCPVDKNYEMFGDRPWIGIAPEFSPHIVLALCHHSEEFVQKMAGYTTAKNTNAVGLAACGGNQELVDLMIANGLSATDENADGNTPADLAEICEHPELAEYLRTLS